MWPGISAAQPSHAIVTLERGDGDGGQLLNGSGCWRRLHRQVLTCCGVDAGASDGVRRIGRLRRTGGGAVMSHESGKYGLAVCVLAALACGLASQAAAQVDVPPEGQATWQLEGALREATPTRERISRSQAHGRQAAAGAAARRSTRTRPGRKASCGTSPQPGIRLR